MASITTINSEVTRDDRHSQTDTSPVSTDVISPPSSTVSGIGDAQQGVCACASETT